ncbi:uncharacterized protein LOC113134833 isoform X2 [Mastacembelus armatus]|uniref:uncharacterized protein LOC113134833 isoform X2 n=1 Tax=Mastacembelus armatus TaxID=205130 RepID=UPI000E45D7E1|nr:uncharacterized protein LOC113134833 isoform X2 [Mastacembelus armatus]
MEECVMKPGVKKKQIKRNNPETLERPVVPHRPTDTELCQTQNLLKRAAATTNNECVFVQDLNPSPTYSQCRQVQSEDTQDSVNELLSENKETGGMFGGLLKKSQKPAEAAQTDEVRLSLHSDRSSSDDHVTENSKEKGGFFSGIFRKSPKIPGVGTPGQDESPDNELSTGNDTSPENQPEKSGGLFSRRLRKTHRESSEGTDSPFQDTEAQKELSASSDDLFESNTARVKKRGLAGIFRRSASSDNLFDEDSNTGEDKKLSTSWESLLEAATAKEKTGGLAGIFKKSPKPAPRSVTTKHPLSDSQDLSASCESLTDAAEEKKVGLAGMFRTPPKTLEKQGSEDVEAPEGGELRHRRTIKKKRRIVSFRVKKTRPHIPKVTLSSQSSDQVPLMKETVELQELDPAQESTVEVQPVEMAAYPTETNPLQTEQDSDELMEWWNTVVGWAEWNETSNFQVRDEEMAVEEVADRVYMAARLFVQLFNQRGASLQHRILELLSLADSADQFHKKTVTAAVGGGVASVVGSVATITGLILAPFTFGTSIIVTAVGISVATAGSITSATANITDTVHSKMDRKKVEKMIQGYQDEMKDIRDCLEFVQEGMDTLQEWDFEKYAESAAKKALNHKIKHVVKEGGRAGKALMINTNTIITTVQILGAAGGAAKAAKVVSVTTGVMSALFLALDIFFLAKDSHKLRKGAKTKFASKIREVCKELQDGLLELNKVKTQLQKTMDGIEVEELEEIDEVEVQVEDDFESDPKKLAELEQELDLLEEKLDKKIEEDQKKTREMEKAQNEKNKMEKKEKHVKQKEDPKKKVEQMRENISNKEKESKKKQGEVESNSECKLEKLPDEEEKEQISVKSKEDLKEQFQKGSNKDKETENQVKAGKETHESKRHKAKEDTGADRRSEEKVRNVKEQEEVKSRLGNVKRDERSEKLNSERVEAERENQSRKSSRADEGRMKPEWKRPTKEKQVESDSTRRHSSRSDEDRDRGSKCEIRKIDAERESSSQHLQRLTSKIENWRSMEEERAMKDWRGETVKSRGDWESNRESKREMKREDREDRKGSNQSHHRKVTAPLGDQRERAGEKQGSRVEMMRKRFETMGVEEEKEEEKGKRREEGESWRRKQDRGHEHSQGRARPRSNAVLGDGLYI